MSISVKYLYLQNKLKFVNTFKKTGNIDFPIALHICLKPKVGW